MRDRVRAGVDRLRKSGWRDTLARLGRAGIWLLRGLVGLALVVYAFSFVGPPPVEHAEIEYDAPAAIARDAMDNLRAATYTVTVTAERTVGQEGPTRFLRETRTVDNRGHHYAVRRLTNASARGDGGSPGRTYGTEGTAYRRGASGPDDESAAPEWHRLDRYRYHPSRNAFESLTVLSDARTSVVAVGNVTYEVRIEDRETVAALVDLSGHAQVRDDSWNATLSLSIDRRTDRLTRAEYQYRRPGAEETIRATYQFDYGRQVDVDRPLGTYPPGAELIDRLDLGVSAAYRLLGGGQR